MKIYFIFIFICLFTSCSLINEDYYSKKQQDVVKANTDLQRVYISDQSVPIFKLDFPDGGQLPKGTSIQYFGERKPQMIQAPKKEYHPVWGILAQAVPFGFGWLTAREYRLTTEEKYKYLNINPDDEYSTNKGTTINLGANGIVALDSSSVEKNTDSKNTDSSTKIKDSYKLTSDQSTHDESIDLRLIDKSQTDNSDYRLLYSPRTWTDNTEIIIKDNQLDSNNDNSQPTDSNNKYPFIIIPTPTPTPTTTR